MPQYWTLFNENILVWFNLIQGLLLPFCLYIADTPFRDAVRFAFRRKQSADFGDLLFSKPANQAGISTLPGYSFAPSSYLTALSDDFCRTEDASLLRIYHNNLATSSSSLAPAGQLNALNDTTKSSLNSAAKPTALNRNNSLHALQYSSNISQKYPLPPLQFNGSSPFSGRLPPKKFVSSSNLTGLGSQAGGFHSYANNDFLLLDKPPLGGPYSGAIHGAPDPRRSSFSCFLSSSGFPGYSTIAEKTHYYSQSKLNNDLLLNGNPGKPRNDLLTPTIKCYQQLFANSVKFEQQLNGLSSPHFVPCVPSGAKFPSPTPYSQHHMTKTNPVYLTNEHFLPNSRKSVATSEIAFTGNENEIDKLKLDQRKSLCEGVGFSGKELLENQFAKQFGRALSQQNKLAKNSSNRLYESPESLECPLLEQLNSLAASSDGGDYQSLVARNLIGKQPNTSANGKFKCSRLANVGLLSNVSSLSQTGARVTPQSKMSRLLGNRKLDLKQAANKQKQRRSFSGEISCELLNSLDSVDEDGQQDSWPRLIEEQEISKSDTERDGCETVWNYSIKQGDKHVYGCVYDDKAVVRKGDGRLDDSSLRKPKLIVDDQLNLVDIENAIRNSTNLLNLSVFNVASDEEDQEELGSRLNLELLKNKEKKNKRSSDDCSVDDFELANDDFEFHTTKSICSKVQTEAPKSEAKIESPKNVELVEKPKATEESRTTPESSEQTDSRSGMRPEPQAISQIKPQQQTNLKESNSFKEIKLAKQDSTKVNGLFKKRNAEAKSGQSPTSSGKIEGDYRRKSITSITPLCSNQTRTFLSGKQSKSVSDLTAQFENCIQNKPNNQLPNIKESRERVHENSGGHLNKRSTSESNLVAEAGKESTGLLPTSTALMLQLIRQSSNGQEANRQTSRGSLEQPTASAGQSPSQASKATRSTGSETITRKKRSEIRKTSSASSSDTNYTNYSDESNGVRRQSRYLKKDEQKISKKEALVSRQQSMLPVPSAAPKRTEAPAKARLQQPPHFRLLSASGLNLPKGQPLSTKIINSNDKLTGSAVNKSNYQIRPTPIAIVPNGSPVGVPVLRKFQQQQSTVYQPIYRNGLSNGSGSHQASHHHAAGHHHANHHPNASHHVNANRSACQQSAVQHRLNKQQSREIELLRRSNSSTSLALDACLLTSAHNKSMPNLFTQSTANHLFPYSFQ